MSKARGRIITPPGYPVVKPKAKEDPDKLTRDEKRRLLAQIVRLNLADCFCPPKQDREGRIDTSGALDLDRVRQIAGPAIQQMVVHETTRTTKKGDTTTQRKITLRLVDKIRAMRCDEKLLEREETEQASEQSEEQKKEYEAAQRRAKALIKWKLLGGPDTPYPTFDEDGYEIEEAETEVKKGASEPPSPARPPPMNIRAEGRERLIE